MVQFDTFQKFGREGVEAAFRSFGAVSTGAQSAAAEAADYAKRCVEQATQAAERVLGARNVESALQIQGDYLRTSYEGAVAQAAKMGELTTNTAREAYAPIEHLMMKPRTA